MTDPTHNRPVGIIVPFDGEDGSEEFYILPVVWDDEFYRTINVDVSRWAADFDADPLAGPFTSKQAAKSALTRLSIKENS